MITDTLLKLMEERNFSKITVKELCEAALVSRQTFYSLFDSKEEVIELHLDTLFQLFVEKYLQNRQDMPLKELCDITISFLSSQKKLLEMMIRSDLDHVVRRKTENFLSILWTSKEENRDYAIAFLTGALMGVVSLAIKNGDFNDTARMSKLLQEMLAGKYLQLP